MGEPAQWGESNAAAAFKPENAQVVAQAEKQAQAEANIRTQRAKAAAEKLIDKHKRKEAQQNAIRAKELRKRKNLQQQKQWRAEQAEEANSPSLNQEEANEQEQDMSTVRSALRLGAGQLPPSALRFVPTGLVGFPLISCCTSVFFLPC